MNSFLAINILKACLSIIPFRYTIILEQLYSAAYSHFILKSLGQNYSLSSIEYISLTVIYICLGLQDNMIIKVL